MINKIFSPIGPLEIKKAVFVTLAFLGIAYAFALTKNIIFFYVYISLTALAVYFFFYLLLFRVIATKLDPGLEKVYRIRKKLFRTVAAACFLLSVNISSLIERYFQSGAIKYFGFLVVFFLSIIVGAGLLALNKKKISKLIFWISGPTLSIFLLIAADLYFPAQIETSSHDQLKSLQYVSWASAQDNIRASGVIKYDKNKTYKGINIYHSHNGRVTYLIDMQGNVLHSWSPEINKEEGFSYTGLSKDGDLLAIIQDKYIMRFDWDGKTKWVRKARAHHGTAIGEGGDFYSLSRKDEIYWYFGFPVPITNDYIVLYSKEGDIKKEISIYDIFKKEIPIPLLKFIQVYSALVRPRIFLGIILKKLSGASNEWLFPRIHALDFFHTNAISVIDRDIPGLCKKGCLIVSLHNFDLVAIVDPFARKYVWKWGPGFIIRQHHPVLLENNNILVFDNGRTGARPYSRVIEINPLTKMIAWEYKSSPPEKFFSQTMGAAQRLPNGNTLITDSEKGRVFEIIKTGEIVWEFYNPEMNKEKRRATISRLRRLIDPQDYQKLANLE